MIWGQPIHSNPKALGLVEYFVLFLPTINDIVLGRLLRKQELAPVLYAGLVIGYILSHSYETNGSRVLQLSS